MRTFTTVYAATTVNPVNDRPLLFSLLCTGAAALGYEILWTRLSTPLLGSETLGVLATLAGFFGGMALGSAVLAKRAVTTKDPIRLLVILETVAALFAVTSPFLLHALGPVVPRWLGPAAGDNQSPLALTLGIAVAATTMLPGTFCMGATLAAATEARRRAFPTHDHGHGAGRVYAANTLGAVIGVSTTIYLILPAFGVAGAAACLGALGVAGAMIARSWGAKVPAMTNPADVTERQQPLDTSKDPDPDVGNESLPLLILVFGAGIVGVGIEVMGVLVLSQIFENTIYTFADVLTIYLLGTAAGAWLFGRWGTRWTKGAPAIAAATLLLLLALANIFAIATCDQAPALLNTLAPEGASLQRHLVGEVVISALVFTPSTLLMGALFSHMMGLLTARGIGGAYALNTLGSAIAPFVFGAWAPLQLGYTDAFYAVSYGYLAIFALFTWFRRFRPVHQLSAMLGVIACTALGPRDLSLVELDEGFKLLAKHETPMGVVLISEHAPTPPSKLPLRKLQIGRHFRMGGAMAFGERRMGHIPLLLRPQATRALFLGVGTGSTLGAVTHYPELTTIDAVELVPQVLQELDRFADINDGVGHDPRITWHAADARRFVAASQHHYDVIVADLFHPGHDGAGGLYSREHFSQISAHLSDGGLFAQWLPLYQLDRGSLQSIVCSFIDVFPQTHAVLGIYNVQTPAVALVATHGPSLTLDAGRLTQRLQDPIYRDLLMQDPRDLISSVISGPQQLAQLCNDGQRNTDLTPWVTLWAPRVSYEGSGSRGADNLTAMLTPDSHDVARELVTNSPQTLTDSIAAFSMALRRYLEGEILRIDGASTTTIPAASLRAYLDAYATTAEFVPARGMLYTIAEQSPARAEEILPEMLKLHPEQRRTWQLWLRHLNTMGDQARLTAARQQAQALFGAADSSPSSAP